MEEPALDAIAALIADCLRAGGDESHQAIYTDGPTSAEQPPNRVPVADRKSMVALVRQFLDPNGTLGGDVRSTSNCRAVTFGFDGQAFLCLRHADPAPVSKLPELIVVTERSEWLVETDWLDGGWPAN